MRSILTVISFSMLALASCCKIKDCKPAFVEIGTINFSQAESDTFIVRRLLLNTNTVKDTLLVSRNLNASYEPRGTDSSSILLHRTNPFIMLAGHDYEIYFPATGTTARITEIQEFPQTMSECSWKGKVDCHNGFESLKLNGTMQTAHRAYIRK